ncbi:hypothetical protein BAE44_0005287 [Dichanthelium oligosanthes]|uniref:Uncharacterized protein n=1 Tax=Dichanthelium oligosanthes TaxID=888268 RepID=A0A1E5W8M4_9POAL|nr:hypothetical protein BAE44_0005287 [Dichanthelium oligosanthes]
MRSSQTQRAQPLPLPLPLPPPPLCLPSPAAAPRCGRHRSSCSSSSSSSCSVSSPSTFCPSPSPAPPPRASTSSLVPFSWERHPGVPKNSFRSGLASPTGTPLPLPPPLQPTPRRRRRHRRATVNIPAASSGRNANSDPFVAAFAECTRDDYGEDDETDHGADTEVAAKDKLWLAPAKPTVPGRAERPWRPATGGFLGFLDLYGCKSAMAVADVAFLARRPVTTRRAGPATSRATRR